MRKICVFIGSRANYSSIKSVMLHLKNNPKIDLQVVLGSSAVLDRFGKVEDLIEEDGFKINSKFYNNIEGENPTTMSKSTGLGIIEMTMVIDNLNPDIVIVVGDRFEMMSIAIATVYTNKILVHTMGGEVTGTIDESIRHAITKFAHIHFPSNEDAKQRIIKLGEIPKYIFNYGCPRIDLVKKELETNSVNFLKENFKINKGVGSHINFNDKFLLVSQHPVTTEFGQNRIHIKETLKALNKLKLQTIMLWPNIDAGSDEISKEIRSFREKNNCNWLSIYKNLPTQHYIHLMNTTSCLVGNSSSGIREGEFIGTPVVNIGSRQNLRLRGENVIDTNCNSDLILKAIQEQITRKKYTSKELYGSGDSGKQISNLLSEMELPPLQKIINY